LTATVKARLTQHRQTKQRQTRPQQSALLGIGSRLLRRPRPNAPQPNAPQQSVLLEIGLRLLSVLQLSPEPVARRHWPGLAARCRVW
jgi:hypothetical protein